MKKRDRGEFTSMSWGASKGGDHHARSGGASGGGGGGGSPFSLSRFLPSRSRRRHHSKSRMSLDSDSHSMKSESSLASHNVTSTSLPAFHNTGVAGVVTLTTPLSRTHNTNVAAAAATASVEVASVKTAAVAAAAAASSSLPSSSLALPAPSPAPSESSMGGVGGVSGGGGGSGMRECPVCMVELGLEAFPPIQTCHHRTCLQCLRRYLQIEISESRVSIACPECNERFHPNDMRAILEDEVLMGKYEDFMLRRVLAMDPDTRWCPAPDCGYAVIAAGCAGCPKLKCEREGCDTYFCYHCKQHWHPNQTCDAARAERSPNNRSASVSYSHESSSQSEIKPCPRCGAFIVKMNDGSCNHMTCAVCSAEFCWLCMKEISDLHYLSPSGCTFWGRKPWSRKKKILWQLGTLVGAPVGITLVAGIAVPAMIIGIPVWVGRKIHARYRLSSKHRRNLAVTGGVAASIIASPIVAGLAVGIGVPILLAYVYGVVPISLCRSGGCGVTTTNTGGVRFEFDEENEGNAQGNFSGDNQSETMPAVANPSIAPSIGDASLGMTNSLSASGSHMERVGILRDADSDRDSASNRAIASASLNGSLCGSTYTNKLEVQADVVPGGGGPHKRASFSSESANISLSEKSATVSFDEASLRVIYSEGHTRETLDSNADGGDTTTNTAATDAGGNEGTDTTTTTSPTTPQSPRPFSRSSGAGGEEGGRHSTKCKKLTRFVDDIPLVSPTASAVVTGDNGDGGSSGRGGERGRPRAPPPLSSSKPDPNPDNDRTTSLLTARSSHLKFCRSGGGGGGGSSSLSGKISINDNVALHPASTTTPSRSQETNTTDSHFPSSILRSEEAGAGGRKAGGVGAVLQASEVGVSRVSLCSSGEVASSAGQVLPEVDTDKPPIVPSSSASSSPRCQSSSDTPLHPHHHHRSRSFSLSCSSLEKRAWEGVATGGSEERTMAVVLPDNKVAPVVATATTTTTVAAAATAASGRAEGRRGLRRHSYELAYRHGRISPSLFDEAH
ncbi:LOW QUALITY PROTEIN: uncharacterized protein LOC143277138 [Babylonia areolata]|uniref:LOW QUALITY PROTEIN: uncharacterized protein LOC143277138 n=1 Tax=Babylonia areolata TaxID=304850 RepID=UPI003FD58C6C